MKKALSLLSLCLLLLLMIPSCGQDTASTAAFTTTAAPIESSAPEITTTAPTTAEITTATPTTSENTPVVSDPHATVSCARAGSLVTLTVNANGHASEEATILVLTDKAYLESWQSHPDALVDLDQITLDENGHATVTLTVSETITAFVIAVTFADGNTSELFVEGV